MEERISSRKNPLLQQVRKLLTSRAERRKTGLFAADGTKLLEEAVKYWPGLETVILSEGVEANIPEGVRVVRVPGDVMASISPMEAPQGALFLGKMPEKFLVAGSGMAGFGSANSIKTRKVMRNFYLCGDGVSDVDAGIGLVSSRVMVCAAHQAHMVLRILAEDLQP